MRGLVVQRERERERHDEGEESSLLKNKCEIV